MTSKSIEIYVEILIKKVENFINFLIEIDFRFECIQISNLEIPSVNATEGRSGLTFKAFG